MFNPSFPTAVLRGADYNPRRISEESLSTLDRSIATLGMCKPVICTSDGLIIAGHQRTKSARRLDLRQIPVYVIDVAVAGGDEIRFNQLHNGTDLELENGAVRFAPSQVLGWEEVEPAGIFGDKRAPGATIRHEMCHLMMKYGAWGAVVASQSGEVFSAGQYALCCKQMRMPCRVYRIADEQAEAARAFFGRTYGEYSYENIERRTYQQSFAQLFRFREGARVARTSSTYEKLLLTRHGKEARILDFGCGQGDYVKRLSGFGYQIWGMEFYRRKGNDIDPVAVHAMAEKLFTEIRRNGLFDVVICDYVLNSTDSMQAEHDVMTCINAFTKPGGWMYFSGRSRENEGRLFGQTSRYDKSLTGRAVEFLDEDGYSGTYVRGKWAFQKFHTREQALELSRRYAGRDPERFRFSGSLFQIEVTKEVDLHETDVVPSLRREFNLMWPEGRNVGKGDEAIAAWTAAKELARRESR